MKSTWMQTTNQYWKWRVFLILIAVCGLSLAFMVHYVQNDNNDLEIKFGLAAVLFFIMALAWLSWSIYCPSCKRRPFVFLITKSNFNNWIDKITGFAECPYCGHPGDKEKTAR